MKHDQKNAERRPKLRIKKGDMVLVIAGADRDLTKPRRVIAVYPRTERILVEGVRIVKRAYRKGAHPDLPQGGIHEKEAPIHISNVALVDPKSGGPTRVGIDVREGKDGKAERVRVAKASGTILK